MYNLVEGTLQIPLAKSSYINLSSLLYLIILTTYNYEEGRTGREKLYHGVPLKERTLNPILQKKDVSIP